MVLVSYATLVGLPSALIGGKPIVALLTTLLLKFCKEMIMISL